MHRFNGFDVELTRGDSLSIKITLKGRSLPNGTLALFTIKKRTKDDAAIVEKKVPVSADGTVLISLSSEDSDIVPRTYYWDLRVLMPQGDGTYEVRTPMEYAAFTILEVVGNV